MSSPSKKDHTDVARVGKTNNQKDRPATMKPDGEQGQEESIAAGPDLLARLPVLRFHGLHEALIRSEHPSPTNNEIASTAAWFVVDKEIPGSLIDLLPMLAEFSADSIPIGQLETRTRNIFSERDWLTWSTIETMSVAELLAIQGAGKKTAWDVVKAAVRTVLDASTFVPPESAEDSPEVFLRVLAAGARVGAETVGEALAAVERDNTELWAEFSSIALVDPPEENSSFRDLLSVLPQRQQSILLQRSRRTLEELGEELGVTRERIRQLEAKGNEHIQEALSERRFSRLRTSMAGLCDAVLSAAPLDNPDVGVAYRKLLEHAGIDPSEHDELWLLLQVAGPLDLIDGDWLRADDWDASEAYELIRGVVSTRIVSLQEAVERTASLRLRDDVVARLISVHPDTLQIDDEHWVRWTGSVVDKADVVLHLLGRPATIAELLDHIGEGQSERSVSNRLAEDDRFVRVDRATFGLSDWGLPEYEGIAREIEKRLLASATGRISRDELVAELSAFAAEASVRTYCKVPRFVVEGGEVRLRRPEDGPFKMPKHTSRAKGLFHFEGRRALTIAVTVDKDLARGSGLGVGSGIAWAVGVLPGQPRVWSRGGESVSVAWDDMSPTPRLSALRSVALSLGADVGDVLFVVLPADGDEFDAFLASDFTPSRFGAEQDIVSDLAACLSCSEADVALKLAQRADDQAVVSALEVQ